MGAKIFSNPNMVIPADSPFSIDKISNAFQTIAANKRADSLLLLQQAKFQYEKDTADKVQRSMTRLSDVGNSGFNWDTTLKDPSAMFSAPLPDVKAAFDKYSEGQKADGLGVNAGVVQNAYRSAAIRNLNLQIGSYNAIKASVKAKNPTWSDPDIYDYMAKNYNADNLYTKTLQVGGGDPMNPASALDPTTGQQVQLAELMYSPRTREVGIGERLMGAFKDPYTGDWNWKASLVVPGGVAAYGLHKYQAKKGVADIAKHAKNVKDGGLNKADWTKKYGKMSKKAVLAEAQKISAKGTTPAKAGQKLQKLGKSKGFQYAAPYVGEFVGESVGGETGGNIGQTVGTGMLINKVGKPGAKSFMQYLSTKLPGIAAKGGAMALADSPMVPIGDIAGLGYSVYEIYRLYKEWTKGQAGG